MSNRQKPLAEVLARLINLRDHASNASEKRAFQQAIKIVEHVKSDVADERDCIECEHCLTLVVAEHWKNGFTQVQLAEAFKLTQSKVSRILQRAGHTTPPRKQRERT